MDPLSLLVSLLGVLAIIGLVFWAMGSKMALIENEEAARARIAWDHPDFIVGQLTIGADGREALAVSADGREAILLFALGNRITCWRQARQQLHVEEREDAPNTLLVTTGDFTLPHLRLSLADAKWSEEIARGWRRGNG
jgi:hypothetical protein